jgi:hypothetical protein
MCQGNWCTYLGLLKGSIPVLDALGSHVLDGVRPILCASTRALHKGAPVFLGDFLLYLELRFGTTDATGLSESLQVVNGYNGSIFVLFGISVSGASP